MNSTARKANLDWLTAKKRQALQVSLERETSGGRPFKLKGFSYLRNANPTQYSHPSSLFESENWKTRQINSKSDK